MNMGYHPNFRINVVSYFKSGIAIFALLINLNLTAQTKLDLTTMSEFNKPTANWHIAGSVYADINKSHHISFTPGTGILVNIPDSAARKDLFTIFKHGDIDLELDCMMAKESNSGIYLQGRYEIQLLDSWGVIKPRSTDMGGIYERNDSKRPEGQRVFDGRAPRQNVSKAPGLWQHYKISFQAPRFVNGVKTENARILKVELNGVVIQENIELSGPTAGSISRNEIAEDALRIQGDHGQVAFKNIVVTKFPDQKPSLSEMSVNIFQGRFEKEPDVSKLKPMMQKTIPNITVNMEGIPKNFYLSQYKGKLIVPETGEFTLNFVSKGGPATIKIDNKVIFPYDRKGGKTTIKLQKGEYPFELILSKYYASEVATISLKLSASNLREYVISDPKVLQLSTKDPVLVEAKENTILRSFMDLPGSKRVTHAVNVGTAEKVNYTYDLNTGMVIQVWRGDFLDASPMWIDRGDGSSKPLGAVQYFGTPTLAINKLANPTAAWVSDTTGTGFISKGYVLDELDRPSFKYNMYGNSITDITRMLENRQGVQRTIMLKNAAEQMYVRLASANVIEEVSTGFYIMDDHAYYLRLDDIGNAKPVIRTQNGKKELILPIQNKITYSILF